MIKKDATLLDSTPFSVLSLCLNHVVLIGLIPILVILKFCLIYLGMVNAILSLILQFVLTFTLSTTDFLIGSWKKNRIAIETLTILLHIDGSKVFFSAFFNDSGFTVATFAKCNKILRIIITADASRNDMMHIKRSSVLFRCLTAMLANLISLADGLCNLFPFDAIIDAPTAKSWMVSTDVVFIPVEWIDKEGLCLTLSLSTWTDAYLFSTSTSTVNLYTWLCVFLANLFYQFFRVPTSIKMGTFPATNCFLAFLRSTSHDIATLVTFKQLSTDSTRFLYMCMSIFTCTGTKLLTGAVGGNGEGFATMQASKSNGHTIHPLVSGYSSIFVRRLVTKPALSVDDQSTLAYPIIPFFLADRKAVIRCVDRRLAL